MTIDVRRDDAPERVERFSAIIAATPTAIFDLLADPSRHREFDGSGTVGESSSSAPQRLELGAKFGMGMKRFVPYRITNEVVEFVEDELIAWRHFGGHIWRYRLEPVESATGSAGPSTRVTEEFDWRPSKIPPVLNLFRIPADNSASIEATLPRLADAVTA